MAGFAQKTTDPNEIGVLGESDQFEGVRGVSHASLHGGIVGLNDNQGDGPGPGVYGESRGVGVYGNSDQGRGVCGHSSVGTGVQGKTDKGTGVLGESRDWRGVHGNSMKDAGVYGESAEFNGVFGVTTANGHAGVAGVCDTSNSNGVYGRSKQANGVIGFSSSDVHAGVAGANDDGNGNGVYGRSAKSDGVIGITTGDGKAGVAGVCDTGNGNGVYGRSKSDGHAGVVGVNESNRAGGIGVFGTCENGVGVWGTSVNYEGIHAETRSLSTAAIAAYNLNKNATGAAIYANCVNSEGIHAETQSLSTAAIAAYQLNPGSKTAAFFAKHMGNQCAGRFEGVVEVTVDIQLTNADCAEEFDIAGVETVESGTVMVLCDEGTLKPSEHAYDKRVAGVISGAGNYRPGIVLDKQPAQGNRSPVALLGKVFCKADASYVAIEVGDMLTTSSTPGYAMKAIDPLKAFGAVIGKALRPLKEGQGLIPILIALQ